jgi:hypothetical protein
LDPVSIFFFTYAAANPTMEKFLREWRQDALNKAQYDSAIFIGDKLLALTSAFPSRAPPSTCHRLS